MDKLSYAIGLSIGAQLVDLGATGLVVDDFAQAVRDSLEGKDPQMEEKEARQTVAAFLKEAQMRKQADLKEAGKAAKTQGEAFMEENKKRDGVVTTASGLQYIVLREGTGRRPTESDKVRCHYEGRLVDDSVFDSSYRRGSPSTFPVDGVIAGWREGLQLMSEGARYRFYIPFSLAYGAEGAGSLIPPYSALIFDVELLEVV